jgi:hypothetical protein
MGALAAGLLESQPDLGADARDYLLAAGMAGHLAAGAPQAARALWQSQAGLVRQLERPLFRLLYCHADPGGCRAAFARYAEG